MAEADFHADAHGNIISYANYACLRLLSHNGQQAQTIVRICQDRLRFLVNLERLRDEIAA